MNNRLVLGLAVAGGYVLGRTKKAKLAFGLGTMVLGKRLKLSPQAIASTVSKQISSNPHLAEMSKQLRTDLKGAGSAATGAILTRQVNGLADSLHERTLGVRDHLTSAGSGLSRIGRHGKDDDPDKDEAADREDDGAEEAEAREDDEQEEPRKAPARQRSEKKPPSKKAPAKRAAARPTAKKTAAKKAVKKTVATRRRASGSEGGSRG
jgi:hypothetical protein